MRFRKGANNHKNDIVIPNVPVCGNGGISTHRIASRLCVNTRIAAVEIPRRALRSLGMTILFYSYRNYSACHLVFAPEIERTLFIYSVSVWWRMTIGTKRKGVLALGIDKT